MNDWKRNLKIVVPPKDENASPEGRVSMRIMPTPKAAAWLCAEAIKHGTTPEQIGRMVLEQAAKQADAKLHTIKESKDRESGKDSHETI